MPHLIKCEVKKGDVQQVIWLAERRAKIGMEIKLVSEKDGNRDGWIVVKVAKVKR